MDNATINILAIDRERAQVERAVQTIYHHVLRDYVAEANRREIMSNLYNLFIDGDIAIISKPELRQYQEMEKNILSIDMLTPKANKE